MTGTSFCQSLPLKILCIPVLASPSHVEYRPSSSDASQPSRSHKSPAAAEYADKLHVNASFAVGDWVLLSSKNLHFKVGSPKLLPRWIGPFQKRVGEVAYELVLPRRWKVHDVFHVSCLEAYRRDGTIQPSPPTKLLDTEDEYEAEAVLDHKDETNKSVPFRSYLVAWRGAPDRPLWEPARILANAAGMVQSYWDHVSGNSSAMPAPIPAPLTLPMVLDVPMAEQLLIASQTRASRRRRIRRLLASHLSAL